MSTIEIINPGFKPRRFAYALFDFDGTLSLIREGWQGIMIPMMSEHLLAIPHHQPESEIENRVREFVTLLTGRQTIYQMFQLVEEVRKRGGSPLDALEYKRQYLSRLSRHIRNRINDLEFGSADPTKYMVPGAISFLDLLKEKNIICYLASGTDREFVIKEAELLRIDKYFRTIYGASDNYTKFSKRLAIQDILSENHIRGEQLVVFGDGYVEMQEAKLHEATAVGVASNEATRAGIDEWKRTRLIHAGADIIVSDFTQSQNLFDNIMLA